LPFLLFLTQGMLRLHLALYVSFQRAVRRALPYEGCSGAQLDSNMFNGAIIHACHVSLILTGQTFRQQALIT
jgi:hypothetical protein